MKQCGKCKKLKDLRLFHKDKRRSDGVQYKCIACAKEAYIDNKEAVLKRSKEHYLENKVAIAERHQKWWAQNSHKNKVYNSKRRSLLKHGNEMPDNFWTVLLEFYGEQCLKCGATERLEHDHVTPLSKGGSHSLPNSQILCKSCNSSKGNRSNADYRKGKIIEN